MFEILRQSLKTGVITTRYPLTKAEVCAGTRGKPQIHWADWKDARPAAAGCPTGAIAIEESAGQRLVRFDLAKCTFCGICAELEPAIRMTPVVECAARRREELIASATYKLHSDGTQQSMISPPAEAAGAAKDSSSGDLETVGSQIRKRAQQMFARSLHIRQVDAGSCNGCELEITNLNSPVYDVERFGIHFVASPRHADLLLVTGPVTRNMELALRKTYEATPEPRRVVAVGACGCSGGIFGRNYASCGGVDEVIPVDVYIPGCPPNPFALLQGILLAMGRTAPK